MQSKAPPTRHIRFNAKGAGSRSSLAMSGAGKPQHWRALQAENGWKRAPVLGFVFLLGGLLPDTTG